MDPHQTRLAATMAAFASIKTGQQNQQSQQGPFNAYQLPRFSTEEEQRIAKAEAQARRMQQLEEEKQRNEQEAKVARAAGVNPSAVSTIEYSSQVWVVITLSNGYLACGSDDNVIIILDPRTMSCVFTLTGHTNVVHKLVQLKDGRLVSAGSDGLIKIWNLTTRNCEITLTGHDNNIQGLAELSNGFIASAQSNNASVKIWNVTSGKCIFMFTTGHVSNNDGHGPIFALAALPNGNLVVSGGTLKDPVIKIFDPMTGRCILSFKGGNYGAISSLVTFPNGWLLSGSYHDSDIHLWDTRTGRCLATFTSAKGASRPNTQALVVVSNDRFCGASHDGKIRVWDVSTRECVAIVSGHTHGVRALTKLQNGDLASGAEDRKINLWDINFRPQSTAEIGNVVKLPSIPASSSSSSSTVGAIPQRDLVIQRELGRGGFGVVYEGLWQGVTKVAIKQLANQTLPESLVNEFKREAEIHKLLTHPNVVAFYGVCLDNMKYALVMELMAKGSLYGVLHSKEPLSWPQRLSMAQGMAAGLLYLHSQNIVHRDLKSLNVLLDSSMQAKLSDFGLAKIKTNSSTATVGAVGTLYWMAPELFKMSGKCSQLTDIYALGITFWEMASRALPYQAASGNQALVKDWVKEGERDEMPTGTPPAFAQLITRCWAQRAEDRPQNAKAVVDALIAAQNDTGKSSGYMVFSR